MGVPVYVAPTKAITIPGSAEALVVRGLSFEDVTGLVTENLPSLVSAVEQYRDSLAEVYSNRSMEGFMSTLLTGTPDLAAAMIARAAGDPDAADTVRNYPAGVQMVALVAVLELTLDDMGSLKDPSPALANLVRQVTGALSARRTMTSLDSSGPSDAQ